ncbi:hypothetical protein H5410_061424 [Solanum commersonii]|uniref:Uncharacterized protein n=1 Tax=Solanum commersonii TaxID=4109 RepID=A0A9J5W7Y3_SOLCO|nr:hypothetical protein H5410_061424 [Solanum commersonii]
MNEGELRTKRMERTKKCSRFYSRNLGECIAVEPDATSRAMLIQLLGSQMDQLLTELYPDFKEVLPDEVEANLTIGA